jgi:hypothetical protein
MAFAVGSGGYVGSKIDGKSRSSHLFGATA